MTPLWQRIGYTLALLGLVALFVLPVSSEAPPVLSSSMFGVSLAAVAFYALAIVAPAQLAATAGIVGAGLAAVVTLALLNEPAVAGAASTGFWLPVLSVWIAAGISVAVLAGLHPREAPLRRSLDLAIPLLFGAVVIYLWEVAVRGFGVPAVLLPAPSATAVRFVHSLPTLGEDLVQTFLRGVLAGYAIGCGAGLFVAIVAHRYTFLGRGLLPIGNFVSALPIVGVAPIMVMWFGFDWPSKAAVVAIITFFPMLVNTLAGLAAAGAVERDLMRSYAATPQQTLNKLYLPAAMPFIFNALKINSTLALIGAIVAEFFGTPTKGVGFRISIEVARMSLDMVWAEVVLAALAGMAFYGIVALAERATTFWHPSYRT